MKDFRHKKILQKKRLYLKENLVLRGTRVLDQLFQGGVLNHAQFTKMDSEIKENEERVSDLLTLLYTRPYEDWEKFLKALSEHNQEHVVKELSIFEAVADPEIKRLQHLLAEKILAYHSTTDIWRKEDEFSEVSIDDIFVDLEITKENAEGNNTSEEEKLRGYKDIYSELLKNKTVVIFGQPGTGKSTLSKRLCCNWAKEQEENAMDTGDLTLHNLSFILPVSLLAVKNNQTLQEYICEAYKIKKMDAEALYNIIERNQESVVLVLDKKEKYDLDSSEEMNRLLYRQLFPKVKMLITSRSPSLPAFCNESYSPIATLSLHGFSDAGVIEYVKNLYTTEGDDLLRYITGCEYRKHMSRFPALLRMIDTAWQEKTVADTDFLCAFVAYTIRRARRKRKGLGTLKKSTGEVISENSTMFVLLGQLAKENIKAKEMELNFTKEQGLHVAEEVKSEFLIEHRDVNGEMVYMFIHKSVQEFFLSYFLAYCSLPEQEDVLLDFFSCRAAFAGTGIVEILKGFKQTELAKAIRTITCGEESEMALLHTNLQRKYVYKYKDAHLMLPKIMYLTALGYRLDFPWKRYMAMDGSILVKLTLAAHEDFLCFLQHLDASNLSSLRLILDGPCSSENKEQIEMILNRFPLKRFDIESLNHRIIAQSAAVATACKLTSVEELMFSEVRLTGYHIQEVTNRLRESVLVALKIVCCRLEVDHLLELMDAHPTSSRMECLDISENYIGEGAKKLVDKTEMFCNLRKLNLTYNLISTEVKAMLKDNLSKYPQLQLDIDIQSSHDDLTD